METITRTAKKNINSGNQPKNNFKRTAHFFVHFLAVVLHDCNVKLPNYTFYGRNVVCVPVRLFFTAAHFLLRQHFFSSHHQYKIVMFFFVSSVFLTLVLALSLFSLQTLKFSRRKKDSALVWVFLSKSPGGNAIYLQKAGVLEMQNFSPAFMKGWAYVRNYRDFVQNQNSLDSQITNFPYPWSFAARAHESFATKFMGVRRVSAFKLVIWVIIQSSTTGQDHWPGLILIKINTDKKSILCFSLFLGLMNCDEQTGLTTL